MKHFVELVLMPSGLITLLVILAGALYFLFKRRRLAGYAIAFAAMGYLLLGSGLVAFWLMGHLEYEYPPGQDVQGSAVPDTMVVLTGYARADDRIPITGHVNSSSGFRLLEAARIFARTRRMTVIISGNDEVPVIMGNLLVELGVPRANIVTEQESNNTYESAVHLRERLAGKRFYLVTSAGHMPRAMRVFLKQGLQPNPAPTDYLSSASLRDSNVVPSGQHLAISDLAIHEYLGLLWYRFLDRI
jgi:uncharacterized SAM-binding protein YcdF (DUF218 family)